MTNQSKKLCAYATIAMALALSPLAAFGQAAPATSPNTESATTSQTTTTDDRGYPTEHHHNYSWIGLLGLAGLAGLMRRRDNHVTYTDRTDTRRTTAGARAEV